MATPAVAPRTWGAAAGTSTVRNNNSFSVGEQQSSSQQTQSANSASFSGIANENALNSLLSFIENASGGGSASFRQQQGIRQDQVQKTDNIRGDYSKGAAFTDALMLMMQNLQQSMEANMPGISRAIQGAGTSASSMQGLLSQKLATESAQAAGALGARQAVDYGQIQASLSNTLEALTRPNMEGENNFLKALDLLKIATSNSSSQGQSTSQSTGSSKSKSGPNVNPNEADGNSHSSGPFTFIGPDDTRKNNDDTYIYQPYSFNVTDSASSYSWE